MSPSQQNVIVGTLVQWTGGKTYGVVTSVEDRIVRVRWDDDGHPPQFSVNAFPLARVDLKGLRVRRKSTGENAVALNPTTIGSPVWSCFVATDGGKTINIPEADLRPVPITDPVERFRGGQIGSLHRYRLQEVTRWYRMQHLHNDLVSLGNVRVDIKPHQVSVVHQVVTNYPHRFLLCDEVGLGKTIEAGMVVKELRSRGGAQRVLAIVPPNLVSQWQFEMKTKFNETFSVLNTNTVQFLKNQGHSENPFTFSNSILCSSRWVSNQKWAELCKSVNWDLVIVDEAHHARSRRSGDRIETTLLYDLVKDLAETNHFARRAMLFLTATPMQLDTHEIYSLVELLDPALFPSEGDFEKHRKAAPGLSRLVEHLTSNEFPFSDEEPHETIEQVSQWLDLDADVARKRLSTREGRRVLAEELGGHHRLSEVMIRNRKAIVGGFMPRVANRWEVNLTHEETEALKSVEDYVQYGFQLAEGANNAPIGFVMVIFQKLMASSIAAIKKSLHRRREKIQFRETQPAQTLSELEERLMRDDDASDVAGSVVVSDMADEELFLLNKAIRFLNRVKTDSKASVFVEQLSVLFDDTPNGKVLVFTEFRETQRHLRELLTAKGWGVNVFHGKLKPEEKDLAVDRFRNESGPQILISTEAGGEGRNFQFCNVLVNYDLPWNPMRVEQRIGRVDRIGQEHTVKIFNLWVKGTIEERVLDVLETRIRVFEETVGSLDPILGDTESDIKKIMRLAAEKREEAIEQFSSELEKKVQQARDAEEKLNDFIMDTKSYRKEIAEHIAGHSSPIDNDDLERFIGHLLADLRTYIRSFGRVYELTFRGGILDTLGTTHFAGGPKKKAVFRPDRLPDSEDVEFMAFGHPIIDWIVERVLSDEYEGVTGTRRISAGDVLSPCAGWLFTYQFTIPGVRPVERIEPIFVTDGGTVDVEMGRRLVQRACKFSSDEKDIDPSAIPDNLGEIEPIASRFANSRGELIQQQTEGQASERVDSDISRLNALFDYRERAAQDRVESTESTLARIRESGDDSQRILPVYEDRLRRAKELLDGVDEERRRRISEVEKYRHPSVDWALKSLCRIEVVASN